MKKVSRSPLGARARAASSGLVGLLRAHVALALAFALLASLAPLGSVARAQGAKTKGQIPVAADGPAYVIYQRPDGEISCRIATPGEVAPVGDEGTREPLVQLNHLPGKQSATESVSAGLRIILMGEPRLELPENAQAKQAFIDAAATWESLISSQISVTIKVDYGPDFFGQPYSSSNTLGATSQSGFIPAYSTVRRRLIANAAPGSEEATLLNNLPATSLPTNIGDVSTIFVTTPLALALGLNVGETPPLPRIGFNSNFSFDFDHTDGVVGTDFNSVAVHEIGHALGFTSQVGARELDPSSPLLATVWDIYRFRPGTASVATFSSVPRVLSTGLDANDSHVNYSGAGQLQLSTGNPRGEGGDEEQASHWKDNAGGRAFIGIMDPTLPRGRHETITGNDLRAIDYFGYTLAGVAPPPPPAGPPNDHFANAQALPASSGSVTGTNVNATSETGEPNHSPGNDAGGNSVWYNWTAPATGSVSFNTAGSDYDTVLAAYTGASVGGLNALAKNDDVNTDGGIVTSNITFNAVGGTTYRIAVDGWDGEAGAITLNWQQTAVPTVVQFSSAAYSAAEGGGSVAVTVTRVGGTGGAFTVNYATSNGTAAAGSDYTAASGTLSFAANEASKTFSVAIINDSTPEANETIQLGLSAPSAGVSLGNPISSVLTILDDDQLPALFVSQVSVNEGNTGTTNATFNVSLNAAGVLPITVNYATANGSASAPADYTAVSGTLSFAPGQTSKAVSVAVVGDTLNEGTSESFTLNLSSPVNAVIGDGQGEATIIDDDGGQQGGAIIEFSAQTYSAAEASRSAAVTVTRSGNLGSVITVVVRTLDNAAAVACNDTATLPGTAFARCDYATTIETIAFNAGETQKTVTVPLIDDSHGEPTESVQLVLSPPQGGATVGAQGSAMLFITSDEGPGHAGSANPIGGIPFFVRQHYLDFLSREPEVGEPWSGVLARCPDQFNSPGCDRLTVSEAFFGSVEFSLKAGYAFRFYKVAFGRMPEYSDIVIDMRLLTGTTGPEVIAKRGLFPSGFVIRDNFRANFDGLSNQQFVDTLMNRYNLQSVSTFNPATPEGGAKISLTRSALVTALNASTYTRAQVLRAIADSDEVTAAEFRPSFVAIQYYGYLRRTPEPTGYQAWLNYLNANPNDSRTMVNGFLNSQEYRLRFGQL